MKGHVNASGFPLQIGVHNAVNNSTHITGWKTLYSEHSWRNPSTNESGFIDLVLSTQAEHIFLNVECKRVKDTSWIFLKDKESITNRRHAKAFVSNKTNGSFSKFGWHDLTLEPSTPQSHFCVIPGTDQKSKSLIERSSAELVSSTEGFAHEQKQLNNSSELFQVYFNVIVTTANLEVCEYDASEIDLSTGTFNKFESKAVPYLRFRKQLSTIYDAPTNSDLSHHDIASMKESTIFVVNSLHIFDFLKNFEIDSNYNNKMTMS